MNLYSHIHRFLVSELNVPIFSRLLPGLTELCLCSLSLCSVFPCCLKPRPVSMGYMYLSNLLSSPLEFLTSISNLTCLRHHNHLFPSKLLPSTVLLLSPKPYYPSRCLIPLSLTSSLFLTPCTTKYQVLLLMLPSCCLNN